MDVVGDHYKSIYRTLFPVGSGFEPFIFYDCNRCCFLRRG